MVNLNMVYGNPMQKHDNNYPGADRSEFSCTFLNSKGITLCGIWHPPLNTTLSPHSWGVLTDYTFLNRIELSLLAQELLHFSVGGWIGVSLGMWVCGYVNGWLTHAHMYRLMPTHVIHTKHTNFNCKWLPLVGSPWEILLTISLCVCMCVCIHV